MVSGPGESALRYSWLRVLFQFTVTTDQCHYSPNEGYEVAVGVLQERLLDEVGPGPVQGRSLRVEAFPE